MPSEEGVVTIVESVERREQVDVVHDGRRAGRLVIGG